MTRKNVVRTNEDRKARNRRKSGRKKAALVKVAPSKPRRPHKHLTRAARDRAQKAGLDKAMKRLAVEAAKKAKEVKALEAAT